MVDYGQYQQFLAAAEEAADNNRDPDRGLFDTPGAADLINAWLEDGIPKKLIHSDLIKNTWALRSNAVKLSFLDTTAEEDLELLGDIAKYFFLISVPNYRFTANTMQEISQVFINFKGNIRRAVGVDSKIVNERILESGSFNVKVNQSSESFNSGDKKSGLAALRSMI